MHKSFEFLTNYTSCGQSPNEAPLWDRVLAETDNFVVIPTIGALVEGWLLIVTRRPYLCMGALSGSMLNELSELKERVSSLISEEYGSVAVFEHGPSKHGEAIGCSVDHAHLHVLPAPCALMENSYKVTGASLNWQRVSKIEEVRVLYQEGRSYLYVEQPLGVSHVADAAGAPSQLFRRVVADAIGMGDSFDWREHMMEAKIFATAAKLSALLYHQGQGRKIQFAVS